MALIQIQEPGTASKKASHSKDTLAWGIDLGTTHSLIGYRKDQKTHLIGHEGDNVLFPSVITYQKDSCYLGQEALTKMHEKDSQTILSVKRLMNGAKQDIKQISGNFPVSMAKKTEKDTGLYLEVGGESVSPVTLSAKILKTLLETAQQETGNHSAKAVITVPAYFDETARAATKQAASLAGIELLRLLNEPTAAAVAYGLDDNKNGRYLVYDLGGGTFDISLLHLQKGVFRVLATAGDNQLGGDDFDRELLELYLWQYKTEYATSITLTPQETTQLLRKMKQVKETLSFEDTTAINCLIKNQSFPITISRTAFERAILPYVEKTLDAIQSVMLDANIAPSDLDGILLVGGSTRVPLVHKRLVETYPRTPIFNSLDPDQVVAMGASIQAESLTKGSDNVLLDVAPLSLGIETMGGLTEKIIHRNSTLPVAKAQEFTTFKDHQTAMEIHVVQGEREMVSDNRSLAKFTLRGIPPLVAGAARVQVTFSLDADGLLTVSAEELTTKKTQEIVVKPSYGLSNDEVITMLRHSMHHAKEDIDARALTDVKIEAERLIDATKKALVEDRELLDNDKYHAIKESLTHVIQVMETSDKAAIKNATKALEDQTTTFAVDRVNKYTAKGLKGHSINLYKESGES